LHTYQLPDQFLQYLLDDFILLSSEITLCLFLNSPKAFLLAVNLFD